MELTLIKSLHTTTYHVKKCFSTSSANIASSAAPQNLLHRGSIEANTNAACLRKLPKLSEYGGEYSADRRVNGGEYVGDESESVDV
jgi:hypothetical protein